MASLQHDIDKLLRQIARCDIWIAQNQHRYPSASYTDHVIKRQHQQINLDFLLARLRLATKGYAQGVYTANQDDSEVG